MRKSCSLLALSLLTSPLWGEPAQTPKPLVVHEWGTFTCLQDHTGKTLGEVNVDDEPVPAFVHQVGNLVRSRTVQASKGVPVRLPNVNLRLETPVVYFHLPAGQKSTVVDVEVEFKGGWLTQYYPDAKAEAPGFLDQRLPKGPDASTTGKLRWLGLKVGGSHSGPATKDRVWTAPRSSKSDSVQTQAGEKEEFLFYRGVGHFRSPLRVVTPKSDNSLQLELEIGLTLKHLWIVEVDQQSRVRYLTQQALQGPRTVELPKGAFEAKQATSLRASMRQALINDGLFSDEADAMLNAWQQSYFKSPGRRVFYLVPHAWTDALLPLSVKCEPRPVVERVMIGRVELITPDQLQARDQVRKGDSKAWSRMGRFADILLSLP